MNMNDKVKYTVVVREGEKWTRVRVSNHCQAIIKCFLKYTEPIKQTQNAVYFEIKGDTFERQVRNYLLGSLTSK